MYKILCINPGSTSTRVAVFEDNKKVLNIELRHGNEDLEKFSTIFEQLEYRFGLIDAELNKNNVNVSEMSIIIGRGGALKPVSGGAYKINEQMLYDCKNDIYARHPSNLGCHLAKLYRDKYKIPAFIIDPPLMDEFEDVARISGIKSIERKSAFHALNEKAVAIITAGKLGKKYEDCNFITVHLGSGISVTAHKKGACVDNNFGLGGDGPFSPERCGKLPAIELAKQVLISDMTDKEWIKVFGKKSGFMSYLKTNNVLAVLNEVKAGNIYVKEIYDAMINDVAKEIGAYSTVLLGDVDAIVLTGALVKSKKTIKDLTKKIEFLAPIYAFPGEYEMEAMAIGGISILKGKLIPKEY